MKTAEIECLRDVAMATNFGTTFSGKSPLKGDNNMGISYKGSRYAMPVGRNHITVNISIQMLRNTNVYDVI